MPAEWDIFVWLRSWRDLGELGTLICPGCAAALAAPLVEAVDGRRWHGRCFQQCGICGESKQRDHESGQFVCRSPTCEARRTRERFAVAWIEIALQRNMDDKIRARQIAVTPPIPGGAAVPWWLEGGTLDGQDMADRRLVQQAMSVAKAATDKGRYDPLTLKRQQRLYREWQEDLRWGIGRVADAVKEWIEKWAGIRRVWHRMIMHWFLARRRWRQVGHTFGRWGRIYIIEARKQRERFLNPDFDQLQDPAERRFAQLEVDEGVAATATSAHVDEADAASARFRLLELE